MSSRDVKIRNVGPKSAAWLRQVGVRSTEDLARIGPVEAFLKIKRAGFRPSLNLLYSMAGALADCHWADLPEGEKQRLLLALEAAETSNPIQSRWDKRRSESDSAAANRSGDVDGDAGSPAARLFDDPDGDDAGRGAGEAERDLSRFD